MSPKFNLHTLLTFLVLINLVNFPTLSSSETECTYPCSPSPPSESATAGTMSPPQLTGGSVYPPPAPGGSFPDSPSPPDQVSSGATLPSPDSVVPWYPYYSKRPTHDTDQPSSTSIATPTVLIGSPVLLVFGFLVSTFADLLLESGGGQ